MRQSHGGRGGVVVGRPLRGRKRPGSGAALLPPWTPSPPGLRRRAGPPPAAHATAIGADRAGPRRGHNAMAIRQDLRLPWRQASVRRFEGEAPPAAVLPGERVPYHRPVAVVDPRLLPRGPSRLPGEPRESAGRAASRRYNRKSVRLLTFESSTWRCADLHEASLRRLGGALRSVSALGPLRPPSQRIITFRVCANACGRWAAPHSGSLLRSAAPGHPASKGAGRNLRAPPRASVHSHSAAPAASPFPFPCRPAQSLVR
jgi:hypothetical protein